MTTKVAQAVSALHSLPIDRQDEIADAILAAARTSNELTPTEEQAIADGIADLEAGRVVDAGTVFAELRADLRNLRVSRGGV